MMKRHIERLGAVKKHHDRPMESQYERFYCTICGFQKPAPKPSELGEWHDLPKHCGIVMGYKRDLKCPVCGFMTAERVKLQEVAEPQSRGLYKSPAGKS